MVRRPLWVNALGNCCSLLAQHIYLPGDNDVGGEADDKRTTFKVNRFNEWFGHDELVKTNIVDFFAVSTIMR